MNEIKRYTSSGISWFNKTLWHRIYSQSNANEFSPYNTRFNSTISTQNKCNRTERIACSTLICMPWSSAHFSPVLLRSLVHRFFLFASHDVIAFVYNIDFVYVYAIYCFLFDLVHAKSDLFYAQKSVNKLQTSVTARSKMSSMLFAISKRQLVDKMSHKHQNCL